MNLMVQQWYSTRLYEYHGNQIVANERNFTNRIKGETIINVYSINIFTNTSTVSYSLTHAKS